MMRYLSNMLDGIVTALIIFGIIIGIVLCAGAYGIYTLFQHLEIKWITETYHICQLTISA